FHRDALFVSLDIPDFSVDISIFSYLNQVSDFIMDREIHFIDLPVYYLGSSVMFDAYRSRNLFHVFSTTIDVEN
ncbi:MAG: hypothetical protein QXU08_09640, partial [Ignisphaera sp.]